MVPDQISHYRIVRQLGAGGMGAVYLARDTRLDRLVALKILPAEFARDEQRKQRFMREAHAASRLSHPNIAVVHEVGQIDDGAPFIVMEYVEGRTLSELTGDQPLPVPQLINLATQIAEALDEAHSRSIVHRDIKPQNILVNARGHVKVLDFGLAKITEPQASRADFVTELKTEPGVVMGTVDYMSPEQALGRDVDSRTDIFSIGVVLYRMATGRIPFPGQSLTEKLDRIVHGEPEAAARFNYSIPPELERIIRKCLEKDPERRYQSAKELLVDLRNLQRHSGEAFPATPIAAGRLPRRLYPRLPLLAALALLVGVAATTIVWMATARSRLSDHARPTEPRIASLAVLPFSNRTASPESEYLSDGLTESLIGDLSEVADMQVLARSTVFHYKRKNLSPLEIGRKLGVDAVVTGEVAERARNLSVSAELVDVKTGARLWGKQYSRGIDDILALQKEISGDVSEKLRIRLSKGEKRQIARDYTADSEAFQLYLKGRYYWNKRTPETIRKGIEFFRAAVEKDPLYALAWAGLADSYDVLGAHGALPPAEAFPRAQAAASKALEIDSNLAEAYASQADAEIHYNWDWPAAEANLRRAIELKPNYGTAHQWLAECLAILGRRDEALAEVHRGLELEPLSMVIHTQSALIHYYFRDYDRAIEQQLDALEIDPDFGYGRFVLAIAYLKKKRSAEAIAEFQKAAELMRGTNYPLAGLAYAYGVTGRTADSRRLLAELERIAQSSYVRGEDMAVAYLGLDDHDKALEWLERGYRARGSVMPFLKLDPRLDPLRGDPRFVELLRRVGIP